MREPTIYFFGTEIPYSAGTDAQLAQRAAGRVYLAGHVKQSEHFDPDFRRRYAAILLRERGE